MTGLCVYVCVHAAQEGMVSTFFVLRISLSENSLVCLKHQEWLEVTNSWGFPGSSGIKDSSAKQEMQVHSLGPEDPLDKDLATCSSNLAWEIPWTEKPAMQSLVSQRVGNDLANEQQSILRFRKSI